MIINQTTTLIFEYPQDYLQEQEWCKTKEDRWIHKSTDTLGAVYENKISYSIGQPNSSEKPNNCEHITEDGVTCAKYPACDDCLDNPLNKVKGSERLVKGSEQTEPTISKMEQVDEPQTKYPCDTCANKGDHDGECSNCVSDSEVIKWKTPSHYKPKDEPQTERSE